MNDDNTAKKDENQTESARVTAENLVESARVTAENLVESARVTAENLVESALLEAEKRVESALLEAEKRIAKKIEGNSTEEIAKIEINNIKQHARIEIENLQESVRIESENMKRTAADTAEHLKKTAADTAEHLKKTIVIETEKMKKIATITAENLMKNANVTSENLRKTATITAVNLIESAKIKAENLMKNANVTSENLRKTATITAQSIKDKAMFQSSESLIGNAISEKTHEISSRNIELEKKLSTEIKDLAELEQEKILLEEISKNNEATISKTHKKVYTLIALIIVVVSVGFVSYSQYENQVIITSTSHLLANYNSNYIIQNLQGDIVNTWVAWNILDGRILHVDVTNTANLSQDKIDAIKDAILSTKTVTLDDSLLHKGPSGTSSVYYTGWEGALTNAYSPPTTVYIPQKFDVSGSDSSSGDIVIILTNDVSPDGLSGLTKSIVDGNQILKSKITIYRASELSSVQLEAITRHEFGHAMGLAHSTAPEDLMHATIQTDYPYISGCDIDAIKGLYNGEKQSAVICKK